jgi:hypothetical protein
MGTPLTATGLSGPTDIMPALPQDSTKFSPIGAISSIGTTISVKRLFLHKVGDKGKDFNTTAEKKITDAILNA